MSKISKIEKEIIRQEVERLKKHDKAQYDFIRNHEKVSSRREFMGLGLLSGFSYLAVPSILSMLSNSASAQTLQECGAGQTSSTSNIPAFIQIELKGGACIGGSFIPYQKDGSLLSNAGYVKFGYAQEASPAGGGSGSISNLLGVPMHSGTSLYLAIMSILQMSAQDANGLFQGMVLATRSENDTAANPLAVTPLINAIKGSGSLTGLVGTQSSANGITTKSAGSDVFGSTRISGNNSVTQLVDLGKLEERIGKNKSKRILEAIKATSSRKLASFNSSSITDQLKTLVNCGYIKANESIFADSPEDLIVKPGDSFSQAFGSNLNGVSLNHASISKLVMQDKASAGGIVLQGYDYHNRRLTEASGGISKKADAGYLIGKILRAATLENKPIMIVITSDGSASSVSNGLKTTNNQNINGVSLSAGCLASSKEDATTSMSAVLTYSPTGYKTSAPTIKQVGGYTADGKVDRNASSVSADVTKSTIAIAANYLKFMGQLTPEKLSEACQKIGLDNPYKTTESLSEIIKISEAA